MKWYVSPNKIDELSFLARKYFDSILELNKKFIKPEQTVLDFGCGQKRIKKILPENNYTGYDIDPLLSDLKEYPSNSYDVVISNHCLEHMSMNQLDEFIHYIETYPPKKLIISLPLENKLSQLLGFIQGVYYNNQIEHQLSYKVVLNRLKQRFSLEEIHTIWFMTILTTWKVR